LKVIFACIAACHKLQQKTLEEQKHLLLGMDCTTTRNENKKRQAEEWEALEAIYGGEEVEEEESTNDDGCCVLEKITENHWKISLTRAFVTEAAAGTINNTTILGSCGGGDNGDRANNNVVMTLYIRLSSDYPSCKAPSVQLKSPQWIIDETKLQQWEAQLTDLYSTDMEAVILMIEHLKGLLMELLEAGNNNNNNNKATTPDIPEHATTNSASESTPATTTTATTTTRTFVPASSEFHQPTRTFDVSIIDSNHKYGTTIYHGKPFQPPKSGPAELLQAFVARVHSMEQIEWCLAQLLLENKKVAKASHNMYAYRYQASSSTSTSASASSTTTTTTTSNSNNNNNEHWVSDSDDDGEKGSGTKLAALLELTNATNCLLVVSRWYGGIQLGPARFKWIASVGRDVLEEHGFLGTVKK